MSEMVERVARAIVDEMTAQTGTAPIRDAAFSAMATKVARVAIAAMREPTEAMVLALLRDWFRDDTQHERDEVIVDWQVMIDAALAPQK